MRFRPFVIFLMFFVSLAHADAPFSKYGVIQNVQNYSSNPFWSPDGMYNQRKPVAVYAMGPDVGTADCQSMVSNLVAVECASRNGCLNTQVSDIRPLIMAQLSRIPGGNYVTACGGYIDSLFDAYVKQNALGDTVMRAGATFPTVTGTGVQSGKGAFEMKNPFEIKEQKWEQEMQGREQELRNLHEMNGGDASYVEYASKFPVVYSDLSFEERTENAVAGYAPYKGVSAYKKIEIEKIETYNARQEKLARMRDFNDLSREEFCEKYPDDAVCKRGSTEMGGGTTPDSGSGTTPGSGSGTTPDSGSGTTPDSGNGTTPDSADDLGLPTREGEILIDL
ncbi:MAG: hypothetical protein R8N50_03345 [Alphaproteobacteria bacterium]|nr:hypothetical protein [Alphaproteobacteria bacterium]